MPLPLSVPAPFAHDLQDRELVLVGRTPPGLEEKPLGKRPRDHRRAVQLDRGLPKESGLAQEAHLLGMPGIAKGLLFEPPRLQRVKDRPKPVGQERLKGPHDGKIDELNLRERGLGHDDTVLDYSRGPRVLFDHVDRREHDPVLERPNPPEGQPADEDPNRIRLVEPRGGAARDQVREAGRDAAVHDRGHSRLPREIVEEERILRRERDVGNRDAALENGSQHRGPEKPRNGPDDRVGAAHHLGDLRGRRQVGLSRAEIWKGAEGVESGMAAIHGQDHEVPGGSQVLGDQGADETGSQDDDVLHGRDYAGAMEGTPIQAGTCSCQWFLRGHRFTPSNPIWQKELSAEPNTQLAPDFGQHIPSTQRLGTSGHAFGNLRPS